MATSDARMRRIMRTYPRRNGSQGYMQHMQHGKLGHISWGRGLMWVCQMDPMGQLASSHGSQECLTTADTYGTTSQCATYCGLGKHLCRVFDIQQDSSRSRLCVHCTSYTAMHILPWHNLNGSWSLEHHPKANGVVGWWALQTHLVVPQKITLIRKCM